MTSTPVLAPTTGVAARAPSLQALTLGGFLVLTVAGLAGVGGLSFAPGWAAAAAFTAFVLVSRWPAGFLAFVTSLWFYTPLVRRVLDFHHGFTPTNLALAAPVLASAAAGLTVIRYARELRGRLYAPALLVIAALTYGFLIGVVRNGLIPATYAFLAWITPALVGLHVSLHWRRYPEMSVAFVRTLAWGLAPAALYGIYQFVLLPPWDRAWMISTDLQSIGQPLPFSVRVFGSMTMPGTFAVVMEVGLLLLLSARVRGRLPSLVLGFIGLLLSRIRTAWLGFVFGLALQVVTQPVRRLPRNWLTLVVIAVLSLPIITIPRFREGIVQRITTLSAGRDDSSVRSRVLVARAGYALVLDYAEGAGLGATGSAVTARRSGGIRNFENGLLEVFYLFGWPGGFVFFLGLLGIIVQGLRLADARFDPFANAVRSGAAALLASLLISEIFTGAPGTLFWVLIGFGVSAHAHNMASGATMAYRAAHFFQVTGAAQQRIAENRTAHDRLLAGYDARHPEIFNPIEQERLARSVERAAAAIMTPTPPDSRVLLDVGAGTGNLTAHLLAARGRVIASDLSVGMLGTLSRRYSSTDRFSTQPLNGTDLAPLVDASVDLVATYSVLHHVPDYLTLVREMARVVRRGGVILIEHEKAPAYWAGERELARFFDEAVVRPTRRWTRFIHPASYWRRIRPFLIWQRWRDPRWMPEGDLHIWPDDHIEWDRVETALLEGGCEVVATEDHLAYEPRFDRATWERYRTRVADTRALIARRAA